MGLLFRQALAEALCQGLGDFCHALLPGTQGGHGPQANLLIGLVPAQMVWVLELGLFRVGVLGLGFRSIKCLIRMSPIHSWVAPAEWGLKTEACTGFLAFAHDGQVTCGLQGATSREASQCILPAAAAQASDAWQASTRRIAAKLSRRLNESHGKGCKFADTSMKLTNNLGIDGSRPGGAGINLNPKA